MSHTESAPSCEDVRDMLAGATGVVYAVDVIEELLDFDPEFALFATNLATPVDMPSVFAGESLIERAMRMRDEVRQTLSELQTDTESAGRYVQERGET